MTKSKTLEILITRNIPVKIRGMLDNRHQLIVNGNLIAYDQLGYTVHGTAKKFGGVESEEKTYFLPSGTISYIEILGLLEDHFIDVESNSGIYQIGEITFDSNNSTITTENFVRLLTPYEKDVLRSLFEAGIGKNVSYQQIYEIYKKYHPESTLKKAQSMFHMLRHKLEKTDIEIENVRGIGYNLRIKE